MLRLALPLLVFGAASAWAGPALGAFTPQLVVSGTPPPGAGFGTAITFRVAQGDDPIARAAISVPAGYQIATAPVAGTKLGAVAAHAVADSGGAVLPLKGDVLAAATATFADRAAQCGAAPLAVWNLHLTGAGQTLDVPIFVVPTAGDQAALGRYTLVFCLPPSGVRLIDAALTVSALTNPSASGEYRWRSLWTPYAPETGLPTETAMVETQSLVRLPAQLTFSTRKSKVVQGAGKSKRTWTRITVTGRVVETGKGVPEASVSVLTGSSATKLARFTTVTTTAEGTFTATLLVKAATWIRAETTLAARALGAADCVQSPAIAPDVPCNGATVAEAHLLSTKVKVYAFG